MRVKLFQLIIFCGTGQILPPRQSQ